MTTIYKDLIQKYPTAEKLFAFLRSDEGGRLIIRDTDEPSLAMIFYEKKNSNMAAPTTQWFRSVVWNKVTNHPVCVSPPRGRKFMEAADAGITEFMVEEFVDGVMINMFYDGQRWRLTTRTQLDAKNHFYGTRSYAELFYEALHASNAASFTDPALCYSFVLQHPEERIVVPCAYGIPRLYLVGCWNIKEDATVNAWNTLSFSNIRPLTYDIKSLEDIKERVATFGKRHGYKWQGFVLKTADGHRYKIRSREYDAAREIRGNQANRSYLWLERWGAGKLKEYLTVYPEEQHQAQAVIDKFKALTQETYNWYQRVYRTREVPLGQTPRQFRKLLWDAHTAGKGAYFANLRDFMNGIDTARKLWLVNFDARFPEAGAHV
jgi:hypothetical protein